MANFTSVHTGATIDASVTIISGSGVTQSDLTKLNAVTSSAVELNILDGVTASTAEINILDGLTASTTELNYLDGADSSITTLSLPDNTTITTFGASLIDDADAATARTTLVVDVAGTDNSTDVTLVTTSHDYLSLSGQAITLGQIDISDDTNLVGGDGLALTGDTLSVNVDDSSIEINSDTLRVKALGVTNAMLAGSIANAKLSNSSVSYGGVSVSLGSSDATPAFDLSDATSLPIVAGTTGTLSVARGGTGATTASGARTNLNVDVAGTDNSTDVTLVTTSHDYLSLSGQAVTLGQIDISDDTNLVGGTGITLTGDTLSTTDSEIIHDDLSGFVSNEHIDHSSVSITAGTGLSGGGDITTSRTLTTDDSAIVHDNLSGFVANEHIDHSGVSITAGAGLTGGGDITATRDIAVGAGTGVTVNANDVAIGQDVGTNADVTFNSVTSDDFIGSLNGAVQFEAKATVALNKGDAVYVVGISGNTPTIALADANDAAKMPSFGLASSSASIDDIIEVVTFGTLTNINTSAFSQGDVLFISSNGTSGNTLTATKEAGESVLCQNIGKVIRSHATVGSIKVGGAGRANATPNLNDGNIFIGNGSNQPVTASLNTKIEDYLDGGTSTANFDTISVDGAEITATPAELNVLDGITSTTAELNYTDGVTSNIQTQLDLKAPLASPAFTGTATGANLTLSGDLTVNGSTTTLDTTNLAVEDNLMELNAGVTSNANDSGFLIERGSTGDNAIFMWDESADKFTLGTTTATGTTTGDITLSSTGTLVANVEGDVTGAVTGNADTATTLATARNFSLTGDVTAGAVSFDGSGNVALATTIAANSVALGTDTTGNYMSDLTEGTGIDITHTPAEGSNGTITLDLTEVGFGGGANRLITDDGDGTVSTEANLTFDGSTLTVNGDIRINDSASGGLEVGTSQDLQIYHNGTNSFGADNYTGHLIFQQRADDSDIIFKCDDGSGGVTTYLTLDGGATRVDVSMDLRIPVDNKQLKIGAGEDLLLYHDGSNTHIQSNTAPLIINQVANSTMEFKTNNTSAMTIDSSQNVVLSNHLELPYGEINDAGTDLNIVGTNAVTLQSSAGTALTIPNASNDVEIHDDIWCKTNLGAIRFGASKQGNIYENNDDLVFSVQSAGQDMIFENLNSAGSAYEINLFIDGSAESVGIGTTSPDSKLQVEYTTTSNGSAAIAEFGTSGSGAIAGSAHQVIVGGPSVSDYTGIQIFSDTTTGKGVLSFADGRGANDNWRGVIQYDHSANDMEFWTDAAERMKINSSGNVGIGTTALNAGAKLNVVSGSSAYTAQFSRHDADDGLFLHSEAEATHYNWLISTQDNVDRGFEITPSTGVGNRTFSTPAFVIKADTGNVGIGETNPTFGLQIDGADFSGDAFKITRGTSAFTILNANDSYGVLGMESNDDLHIRTNGNTQMVIDNDGNVGIGTASPSFKLKVNVDNGTYTDIETIAAFQSKRSADSDTEAGLFINAIGDALGGQISSNYYYTDNVAARGNTGRSGAIFGMSNNAGAAGTHSSFYWQTSPNNSNTLTDRMQLDTNGNLKLFDNTANPSASAENAFLFCDSGELKVLDDAGNTTTISPHNFDLIPGGASEDRAWGYYSEKDIVDDEGNVTTTQKVNVDMMKLARLVEELTGEKLVYTEED